MDKYQILNELKVAISIGIIQKEEVLPFISGVAAPKVVANQFQTQGNREDAKLINRMKFSDIMYYVGGLIVFIGLVILVGQNWDDISFNVRVLITLGSAIVFFASACLLLRGETTKGISYAFFIISALLTPFGYFVLFEHFSTGKDLITYNIIASALCLLQFGIAQMIIKKSVFTPFNLAFGTWLFFALTNMMISDNPLAFPADTNFQYYRVLLIGLSYLLIGRYISAKGGRFLGLFNNFGILGVLGATFGLFIESNTGIYSQSFGGYQYPWTVWLIIFPILTALFMFLSIRFKNLSYLIWGIVFLMFYIFRITYVYFSHTVGWPLALVGMGLLLIFVGFFAVYISNKYIKPKV